MIMTLPKTVVASPAWIAAQDPECWLTPGELLVWAAWNLKKRKSEWLAGRIAAKTLLWDVMDIAPLSWSVGRDGAAPSISGVSLPGTILSLSHSDGMGAATLSDSYTEGSAGIDIQRIRPVHPGLCARVFTLAERAQIAGQFGSESSAEGQLLFWSLKEAAIKARRLPWVSALQSIEVRLLDADSSEIVLPSEPPMTAQYERLGEWWLARAVTPAVKSASDKAPAKDVAFRD